MFNKPLNKRGFSLIELLVVAALLAFVVGLSVTPILQMKKIERKADFQTSLNTAHQVALQKARNGKYLKDKLGITPGSPIQQCFGGRGVACSFPDVTDTFTFNQSGGYDAAAGPYQIQSAITIKTICPAPNTKCTDVDVSVVTKRVGGKNDLDWKGNASGEQAVFKMPALSLASRQEIDFTGCDVATKILTGINYETLTAICEPMTGNVSCTGIAGAGPLSTVGNANPTDPANCQPPPASTCANGMTVFGLVGDQPQCNVGIVCVDPLSSNCAAPAVCIPNYQPMANTVCNGTAFTQIDANNCPGSVPVAAVGSNPALCAASSCSMAGTIRWPNPVTGPCSVASALGSAAPGASATIANETAGYYGTLTATCVDNSPAPNTFNFAAATNTCAPVVCSGVPTNPEWSATGLKSGTAGPGLDAAGPWDCNGAATFTQGTPQAAGVLLSTQADATAKAVATSSSGSISFTCNDPGPTTGPHAGVLNIGAASCTTAAMPCSVDYTLEDPMTGVTTVVENVVFGIGDSRSWTNAHLTVVDGNVTIVGSWPGPVTAMCVGAGTPPPPPPCSPDGYMTGIWSGADDALCVNQSSFAGLVRAPNPSCCSGFHQPSYGPTDTIGGGKCNWKCVP